MASNSEVCNRWAKSLLDSSVRIPSTTHNRVKVYEADAIYSYGSHFQMAKLIRNKDRSPKFVLINGDTFSVSTTRHQGHVRDALRQYAGEIPTLIIPFTALDRAGIIRESIEILDTKGEGRDVTIRESKSLPRDVKLKTDGIYHDFDNGHYHYTMPEGGVLTNSWNHEVRLGDDGIYRWRSVRHWLGDSLISAKLEWSHDRSQRRVKFLSSFDRQETNRLYFLCQLPRTAAVTFDDAIEALKPDPVVLAEGMGRTVTRQGDMFAVPIAKLTKRDLTKSGAKFSVSAKSVPLIGTSHTATLIATMPDGTQYARGTMYHKPSLVTWGREPEHRSQKMGDGKTWHLIVKNTVPVRKRRG